MNKKINVIKINGFKGIVLALFIVGCLVAGFLIFPGWVCKNIWNFTSQYFMAMPTMTLLHGTILWVILALSAYALNKGKFAISIGSGSVPSYREYNDRRIKEILKQISEKNENIASIDAQSLDLKDEKIEEDDKISKD